MRIAVPSGRACCEAASELATHRFEPHLAPKLPLADEPTGNLDSKTGKEILDLLQDLNRNSGLTVIMVTHERDLADRYARRQIFLADGKIVGDENRAKGERA